jgi:glycosyltransferase involved in cell wall biosynthesis
MASARPVVASDDGGPREIVVHGETGLLVPPGDVAALASAMESLLADPALAQRLGAAGRARARERFGIDRTVTRLQEIWTELGSRA